MAGQKFEYDESGSTFLYFLISFLGLVLFPCTLYFWPSDPVPETVEKTKECRCDGCRIKEARMKKPEKWKGIKKNIQRFFLILGWLFMAFLIYKVQGFDYEYANFDPWDILGVSTQASQAEIKKAYRKQSLIYHPDKPTGDNRKFMKLNKAYQALTDDVARRNYELYGNPDGPGAMHFGIALPSWIVEKENSLWVLGLYALIFMIGLPTGVSMWWYRSSKFSNDQVLLDTTQLYYYFFHKTPTMTFKRALMVLAASFEFKKGHNPEIIERPTDNIELPTLMKQLPNLGEKNKEKPLCYTYSIKARALLHSHLSRMLLPENTLDFDRLYIVSYVPTLVQEMVTCLSQLVMLAYAGRIGRLPSLDTIEATMKLSPHVVQALWESKSPMLQLPHVFDDSLRLFVTKQKKVVKTIQQLVQLSVEERKHIFRSLYEEQYNDVMKVCSNFPHVEMDVNYEVVDDDDSGVFTAGAIVTVTVTLSRTSLGEYFEQQDNILLGGRADEKVIDNTPKDNGIKKPSGWRKPQTKKASKPKTKSQTTKKKDKVVKKEEEEKIEQEKKEGERKSISTEKKERKEMERMEDLSKENSEEDESVCHSDESAAEDADTESHKDDKVNAQDDDAEWEKFQKGLTKREKALEGKSKMSHSVHCPFFPEDKQEYWWAYVCDRKNRVLISAPYLITNLVSIEEVQLKFTAPFKPGVYTYQICLRSDSYLGADVTKDIKLDVKEAREIPVEHPQWEECETENEDSDSEGTDDGNKDGEDSEFTTDDDLSDDDYDEED